MANTLFDSRFLNSARLQTVIEVAASELERMRPLTFLDRLTLVNAVDDELMGRFTARLFAADIIADGQEALVVDGGQIELSTTQIPNIKIGANLNQATINMLERLDEGFGRAQDEDAAYDWFKQYGENLLAGVRERMNMMACAMMLDSFTYDRWGVKLTAASWGMPSNLKVTPTAWSGDGGTTANAAATPLTDIWNMDKVDADNYGLGPFDRVTMGSKTFDFLTQTTEFANRSWVILGSAFLPTSAAIPNLSRDENRRVLERMLQKTIMIDDKTIRTQANDGTQSTTRVLPLNKVLLDRTSNGPREWDFGNAVVTESIVAKMVGSPMLGTNPRLTVGGGSYGPVGYFTPQTHDLNAPGINGWAVCRGFPRKKIVESSAVLTVW